MNGAALCKVGIFFRIDLGAHDDLEGFPSQGGDVISHACRWGSCVSGNAAAQVHGLPDIHAVVCAVADEVDGDAWR